jgi:4-diphosphocytidyl-2-C-methyl-D-erythritol kinase
LLRLFSPAKINLFLKVVRKRPDGYHELETLFERIGLCDEIVLKPRASGIVFKTFSKNVPSDASNLAYRAAQLLQKEAKVNKGVEISLKKNIPVAAGLGGGSSNAATVILGLNKLWKLKLSKKRLMKIAAKLGSDIPFFVMDGSWALGKGRGEKLTPMAGPGRKIWHVLVKPPFGISTKEAYAGLAAVGAGLTPPGANVKMLFRSLQTGDSETLSNLLTNSLELVLNKRVKTISDIKQKLVLEGAFASLMSGSGSTVFGLFKTEKEAKRAARILKRKNRDWRVYTAATY